MREPAGEPGAGSASSSTREWEKSRWSRIFWSMPKDMGPAAGYLRGRARHARCEFRGGARSPRCSEVVGRGQAARRGGFGEQNIVEKLACAFRPGKGKRVRSCLAARNFKCRETSDAQIHVEHAGATRADNV